MKTLILGIAIVTAGFSEAAWVVDGQINQGRNSHAGCVIDGKAYVFGGNLESSWTNLNTIEAYDLDSHTAVFETPQPDYYLEELTGTAFDGKLYVFGGYGRASGSHESMDQNISLCYDPATKFWTTLATRPDNGSLNGCALVYSSEIFLFGGDDSTRIHAYNPSTDSWRYVTDIPASISAFFPGFARVGNLAYLIGGYDTDSGQFINSVATYNFDTGMWVPNATAPIPAPARAMSLQHTLPVIDGKIYCVGGYVAGNGIELTDAVSVYDTATDSWTSGPDLPYALGGYCALQDGGSIYVVGGTIEIEGGPEEDDVSTNAVLRLDVVTGQTYTLDVQSGSGDGSYTNGAVVPVSADAPAAGSLFAYWTVDPVGYADNLTDTNSATTDLLMPSSDITLVATYACQLEVLSGDGDGFYTSNTQVSVIANEPLENSIFSHWSVSQAEYLGSLSDATASSNTFSMPATNVALTANYAYRLYVNGSSLGYYTNNASIPIVAGTPPVEGTHFSYWMTTLNEFDENIANATSPSTVFTMPSTNMSVSAVWATNTYVITAIAGPNGAVSPTNTVVMHGENRTFLITPDTNYHIESLSDDGVAVPVAASYTFTNVQQSHTFSATFSPITYTVTFDLGEGLRSGGGELIQTVEYGNTALAPSVVPSAGYTFDEWSVSFANVQSNITVQAIYELKTYEVTFDLVGGTWSGGGALVQTVEHAGSAFDPAVIPPAGYTFDHWSISFADVQSNITVQAIYEVKTYEVIFDLAGGTRSGGGALVQTVEHGGPAFDPIIIPPAGYTFDRWSISFVSVQSNITVTAIYELKIYEVIFDLVGGIRSGGGALVQSVEHGGSALAPAVTPPDGYVLDRWSTTFDSVQAGLNILAIYKEFQRFKSNIVVSNVRATQLPNSKIVVIHYDVADADGDQADISLKIIIDQGVLLPPIEVVATTLTGDIGENIICGKNKTIRWDAGADWSGNLYSNVVFEIMADNKNAPFGGDLTAVAWEVITTRNAFGYITARWVKNTYADGAVTMSDLDTGLMWVHDASANGTASWSAAVSHCLNLTYAGHSDWFLSDINTLYALYSKKSVFTNVHTAGYWYWSSSSAGNITAWSVYMSNGMKYDNVKSYSSWIWPCRFTQ